MNEQGRCFCFAEKKQYSEYVGEDALSTPAVTFLDHPRVCGEKADWTNSDVVEWGSPPRVRGKESDELGLGQTIRITPARAGKSGSAAWHRWACRDHPRACGEKPVAMQSCMTKRGSPPRVRGKAPQRHRGTEGGRITPACAGKRGAGRCLPCKCGDHPRVCGEKFSGIVVRSAPLGSPPRVRGKVQLCSRIRNQKRITPACAGKSTSFQTVCRCRWDHPRVCGEKG